MHQEYIVVVKWNIQLSILTIWWSEMFTLFFHFFFVVSHTLKYVSNPLSSNCEGIPAIKNTNKGT